MEREYHKPSLRIEHQQDVSILIWFLILVVYWNWNSSTASLIGIYDAFNWNLRCAEIGMSVLDFRSDASKLTSEMVTSIHVRVSERQTRIRLVISL